MRLTTLTYFICAIALLGITRSEAQSWQLVGPNGFSNQYSQQPSIALTLSGVPYVAFTDGGTGKVAVMQFNGTSWQYTGQEGFSDTLAEGVSIAFGKNDTPYVAYIDEDTNGITVKKFDGTNWVTVGVREFTGTANYVCLVCDKNGTPYVSYADYAITLKCSAMKYNGSAWEYVGNRGFSIGRASAGSMALDTGGTPYVAISDGAYASKATVMKFDGSGWSNVGAPGFSDTSIIDPMIAVDSEGTPYVAYLANTQIHTKLNVMKFSDTSWSYVGGQDFLQGDAAFPAIAISRDGTPYISYAYDSSITVLVPHNVNVMKFYNNSWTYVGNENFSNCYTGSTGIAIDSTGVPYVVYDNVSIQEIVVQKYPLPTSIASIQLTPSFNLYPIPTSGKLEIEAQNIASNSLQFTITDISGQVLIHQTINSALKNELDVSELPAGLYLIQLQDGQQNLVQKFVKE